MAPKKAKAKPENSDKTTAARPQGSSTLPQGGICSGTSVTAETIPTMTQAVLGR